LGNIIGESKSDFSNINSLLNFNNLKDFTKKALNSLLTNFIFTEENIDSNSFETKDGKINLFPGLFLF